MNFVKRMTIIFGAGMAAVFLSIMGLGFILSPFVEPVEDKPEPEKPAATQSAEDTTEESEKGKEEPSKSPEPEQEESPTPEPTEEESPPVSPDEDNKAVDKYFDLLAMSGIVQISDKNNVEAELVARNFCDSIRRNNGEVTTEFMQNRLQTDLSVYSSYFTAEELGAMYGAAAESICPDHGEAVRDWSKDFGQQ